VWLVLVVWGVSLIVLAFEGVGEFRVIYFRCFTFFFL